MDPQILDTKEAIVANAAYHARLLDTISSLEYVPTARKHQSAYVKDLETQLAHGTKRVAGLAEKTKKERKEHEALRDSTARRFASRIVGRREKWEEKESKEEREYVEALEREINERESQNAIQQLLDEGKRVMADLIQKQNLYESARAELQVLYGRIFDGPTEEFPEDDRLEYDLNAAIKRHEEVQAKLNAESRAAELLARAARCMVNCQDYVQEALGYSRYDMWGGGTMADMMERNALTNARGSASQSEMFVEQARRVSPGVKPVKKVNIAQGSIVGDIFFDNIFTDMAFHTKIKQSAAEVFQATLKLKEEREAARRRADAAGSELMEAAMTLDTLRKELDQFRSATFESFIAQNPPPPDYENITSPGGDQQHGAGADQGQQAQPPGVWVGAPSDAPPPFPVASTSRSADSHMSVDEGPTTLTASPQPQVSASSTAGTGILGIQMPEPQIQAHTQAPASAWRSRNPYAAAIVEQTRKLSEG